MGNTTKRIAIFASYTNDEKLHEYVIYYLRELKKVCDDIIFVSDCSIDNEGQEILKEITTYFSCERHGEYDFGSYKRGYLWAKEHELLKDADELILCNDSCYGPIFPFEELFATMQARDCDYWGLTESHEFKTHLQSFFLVYKKKAFNSKAFHNYIMSVEKQDNVDDVIKSYELMDIEAMKSAGLRYDALVRFNTIHQIAKTQKTNPILFIITLLREHMPLLKRKTFLYGYEQSLQESPMECLDMIGKINPTLHEIICKDIPSLYANMGEVPKNAITESSRVIEKTCGGEMAIKIQYKMIEEALRMRPFVLNVKLPIVISDDIPARDFRIVQQKNIKHLKAIRKMIWVCAIQFLIIITLIIFLLL